jgi:RadC-like JAB domain
MRYNPCHAAYGITGDPSPSDADLRLTRRINEASRILQLQLIDHVIIGSPAPGRSSYFSFKEGGVISRRFTTISELPNPLTNLYQIHQISEVGTLRSNAA